MSLSAAVVSRACVLQAGVSSGTSRGEVDQCTVGSGCRCSRRLRPAAGAGRGERRGGRRRLPGSICSLQAAGQRGQRSASVSLYSCKDLQRQHRGRLCPVTCQLRVSDFDARTTGQLQGCRKSVHAKAVQGGCSIEPGSCFRQVRAAAAAAAAGGCQSRCKCR